MSATSFCRVKKVLREESEDVNRLKDEFLATVSHKAARALNAIHGWVKLLREGRLNQDETARALEIIERRRAQAASSATCSTSHASSRTNCG